MQSNALSLDWEKICRTIQLAYKVRSTGVIVALCPFHNEKTPSCHMWPKSGNFYCFGCGTRGNQREFLSKALNVAVDDPSISEDGIYRLTDAQGQLLMAFIEH